MKSIISKLGLENKDELIVLLHIAMNKGYGYELVLDGYELTSMNENSNRFVSEEELSNIDRDDLIRQYKDIKPISFFYIEDETKEYHASLTNDEYRDIRDLLVLTRALRDINIDEERVIDLLK